MAVRLSALGASEIEVCCSAARLGMLSAEGKIVVRLSASDASDGGLLCSVERFVMVAERWMARSWQGRVLLEREMASC